jgi:O-antigen ligase
MRRVQFAGHTVNLCAADLMVVPVLLLVWRRWVTARSLCLWLFALWMVNLVSWGLSLPLLEPATFVSASLKLIACFMYALVGFGIAREWHSQDVFIKGLAAAALPVAALGISAFLSGVPQAFLIDARVVGTFTDPNAFAVYLAMVLPLIIARPVGWIGLPLFIGAGLVSLSRTGLAAMGTSLLLGVAQARLRQYLPVALACGLAFLLVWGTVGKTNVGQRIVSYHRSLEGRQELWALAADVAQRYPITGIGKGNWEMASRDRPLPHNTFLTVLVDTGLIGIAVFLVPIIIWLWRGVRQATARPWAVALLAGMVGGLAVSFDNSRFFWLAVGALAGRLAAAPAVRPDAQMDAGPVPSAIGRRGGGGPGGRIPRAPRAPSS